MGHYDRQGRWKGSGQPGQPPAPAGARRANPDGAAGGERTRAAQAGSVSGSYSGEGGPREDGGWAGQDAAQHATGAPARATAAAPQVTRPRRGMEANAGADGSTQSAQSAQAAQSAQSAQSGSSSSGSSLGSGAGSGSPLRPASDSARSKAQGSDSAPSSARDKPDRGA